MKTVFSFAVLAVLLVAPRSCFALWEIMPVSKEAAKELGLEVRSRPAGPDHVMVTLEFATEGKFEAFSTESEMKDRSRVDLRFGEGNKFTLTAPLREDRTKPGRVAVMFTAERAQLEKLNVWVMVPEADGGIVYDVQVKDFVEGK